MLKTVKKWFNDKIDAVVLSLFTKRFEKFIDEKLGDIEALRELNDEDRAMTKGDREILVYLTEESVKHAMAINELYVALGGLLNKSSATTALPPLHKNGEGDLN